MVGGPDPETLIERGLIGEGDPKTAAAAMRDTIDRKREQERSRRENLRERVE
ncbi:hypothetical protein ACFQE1_00955 [Halobium palmae]|uniref:Uncharacterized protein n=1 Tax=Halobium palmae TaxID=1776492 RepID=A0ABD5RUR8_9EURY